MYEGIILSPSDIFLHPFYLELYILMRSLHHRMRQTVSLEAASLHVTSLLAIIFETLYFDKIIRDVQPYQYNRSCLSVSSLHSWSWKF